jgi:hypothetical protein
MPGARCAFGLAALLVACATPLDPNPPLRLSRESFLDTGLYRVERMGPGEIFVAPDVERVRERVRGTDGLILGCRVATRKGAQGLPGAEQVLERRLCDAVARALEITPDSPHASTRLVTEPGPGVLRLNVLLLEAESQGWSLFIGPRSTLSMRFYESTGGRPVLRYYETIRSAADDPLDDLVAGVVKRMYVREHEVLRARTSEVASNGR